VPVLLRAGIEIHTFSCLVFASLPLPSVLRSRQIRGSEETAGIQGED